MNLTWVIATNALLFYNLFQPRNFRSNFAKSDLYIGRHILKDIFYQERENRIWRLRYHKNWPLRRIAAAAGVSISTVRNVLKQRKTRLVLGKGPKRTRVRF